MHRLASKTFCTLGLSSAFLHSSDKEALEGIPLVEDEHLVQGRFSNGLSYYIKSNRFDQKKASLRLVVKVGSINETEEERGLAHFVEHMVFRGSENFADGEVIKYLESIGAGFGGHTNAYTSFDETVYMFDIPLSQPDTLTKSLSILSEFATKASFSSDCLEIEKGVVLDELRLRKSSSKSRRVEMLVDLLLSNSLYGKRQPIGLESVIQACTRDQILHFYQKWYQPQNMALIAVGDFDASEVLKEVEKIFEKIKSQNLAIKRTSEELKPFEKQEVFVVDNPENINSVVYLTRLEEVNKLENTHDYEKLILDELIFTMLNRRLEIEGEKSPSPFEMSRMGSSPFVNLKNLILLYGVCWDKSPLESIEVLIKHYTWACISCFFEEELHLAKARLKASLEAELENADKITNISLAQIFLSRFLSGGINLSVHDQKKVCLNLLDKINLSQTEARRKELFSLNDCKLLYFPSEKSTSLNKEDIERLFSNQISLEQMTEFTQPSRALFEQEERGSIIQEKEFNQTRLEFLKLENGMEVYLDSNDLKKNLFSIQLRAKGGLNSFHEKDYYSASMSCEYSKRSGLAGLSATELHDLITGKNIHLDVSLNTTERVISGLSSNQDMETFFSLLKALFEKREFRSSAWDYIVKSCDQYYEMMQKNSEMRFANHIYKLTFCDHYALKPPHSSVLFKDKAEKALDLFFADPSEFIMVISGDFDKKELIECLQKYVATIQKKGTYPMAVFEAFPDPIELKKESIVGETSYDESQINLQFTLNLKNRDASSTFFYHQALLENIISRKLLEKLRAKIGETYGIHCKTLFVFYPSVDSARLMIQFSSQTGKEEWMVDQLFTCFESIINEPILDEDVEKAINIYHHQKQKLLLTNEGRIDRIFRNFYFPHPMNEYIMDKTMNEAVDKDDLMKLLKEEIDLSRYTLCIKKG